MIVTNGRGGFIGPAAAQLAEAGGGTIVNVSSTAAMLPLPGATAYAASKGALNNMTVSLARALAPSIRVNAVCPAGHERKAVGRGQRGQRTVQAGERSGDDVCRPDHQH